MGQLVITNYGLTTTVWVNHLQLWPEVPVTV